jgi:hypothetical protein
MTMMQSSVWPLQLWFALFTACSQQALIAKAIDSTSAVLLHRFVVLPRRLQSDHSPHTGGSYWLIFADLLRHQSYTQVF